MQRGHRWHASPSASGGGWLSEALEANCGQLRETYDDTISVPEMETRAQRNTQASAASGHRARSAVRTRLQIHQGAVLQSERCRPWSRRLSSPTACDVWDAGVIAGCEKRVHAATWSRAARVTTRRRDQGPASRTFDWRRGAGGHRMPEAITYPPPIGQQAIADIRAVVRYPFPVAQVAAASAGARPSPPLSGPAPHRRRRHCPPPRPRPAGTQQPPRPTP